MCCALDRQNMLATGRRDAVNRNSVLSDLQEEEWHHLVLSKYTILLRGIHDFYPLGVAAFGRAHHSSCGLFVRGAFDGCTC